MRDALPEAILVGDSTQPVYAGNLGFAAARPGSWFNSATGYGTLGYALPAVDGRGARRAGPAGRLPRRRRRHAVLARRARGAARRRRVDGDRRLEQPRLRRDQDLDARGGHRARGRRRAPPDFARHRARLWLRTPSRSTRSAALERGARGFRRATPGRDARDRARRPSNEPAIRPARRAHRPRGTRIPGPCTGSARAGLRGRRGRDRAQRRRSRPRYAARRSWRPRSRASGRRTRTTPRAPAGRRCAPRSPRAHAARTGQPVDGRERHRAVGRAERPVRRRAGASPGPATR